LIRISLISTGLAVAGFLLPAWVPQAMAKIVCPPAAQAPSVTVRIKPGGVVINNRQSHKGLRRLHNGRSTTKSAMGWNPVGLTSTELGFQMKVRVSAVPSQRNRYCGYLDSVDATVGYEKLTVYVARKYRPGSCQYGSIMDHEKLHVMVFRRILDRYAPRLERRITSAAARLRPVVTGNAKQAASRLKNKLKQEIQPLFREMNQQLNRDNAKLDTPQNYKREQARCENW
jgi:hypothetical protein